MRKIYAPLALLGSLVLFASADRLLADSFFDVNAVGSGGTVVNVGAPNIIHLTNDIINENNEFAPLAGQNVTATLTYGGVPNAIILSENASQTSATLTIPSTGFTKTFTGTSSSDLQTQIKNFIKSDGESAYASFLEAMDQQSPVAALDGNPQAATAVINTSVFNQFGVYNEIATESKTQQNGFMIGGNFQGGLANPDDLHSTWADLNANIAFRITDNVALAFGTTLAFRDVDSSDTYTLAEDIGLPISILLNSGDGFSWQVTPWGFAGVTASYDQAAGSVLVGGGGTSSLALHLSNFTVTMGNQISYNGDVAVNVDGYGFDTNIDQWIVKNGVDGAYRIPYTPVFLDASVTYSNFLNKAAVPDYWTPSGGVGIVLGKYSGIRVAYIGDFGPGYNSNGAQISFYLTF